MVEPGTQHGRLVVMGVGDVGPYHEPLDGYPTLAKPVLATADVRLTTEESDALDAVSQLPVGDYPYGPLGMEQRQRPVAGGRA